MPKAARVGDTGSGHGCWPSHAATAGSPDVHITGSPAHRRGDAWAPHTCPAIPQTHRGVLAGGSSSVRVNGRPAGRVGDAISCGGSVITGADSVRIGG